MPTHLPPSTTVPHGHRHGSAPATKALQAMVEDAMAGGTPLMLVHLDIDHFASVNENMSVAVGDLALDLLARRLEEALEGRGRLWRHGSDEFIAAIPLVPGSQDATDIAPELQREAELPLSVLPYTLFLTVKLGVSLCPGHAQDADALLRMAEIAVRHASHGDERIQFYGGQSLQTFHNESVIARQIIDAIPNGELRLRFQPEISARDGRVVGMEALLRWQSPSLGLLVPERFMPTAERLGVIVQIGGWVPENAIEQVRQWREAGFDELFVTVNVSTVQLQRQGVPGGSPGPAAPGRRAVRVPYGAGDQRKRADRQRHPGLRRPYALRREGVGLTGQFRHRRFEPQRAGALSGGQAQDRPQLHPQLAGRRARDGDRARDHRHGPPAEHEGDRQRGRDRGAAGLVAAQRLRRLPGYLFGEPMPAEAAGMALRRRYLRPELFAASKQDQTLLLVDDEENVLRSLVRLFRRDGYRILAAGDVRDAFDLLATNEVQVILSDQRMSDMSGTEFLGRVKMLYPDTVRMVLSGYTDLTTVTDAINRGAIYRFLTKPWNDDELREHIRQAFRTHRSRQPVA